MFLQQNFPTFITEDVKVKLIQINKVHKIKLFPFQHFSLFSKPKLNCLEC